MNFILREVMENKDVHLHIAIHHHPLQQTQRNAGKTLVAIPEHDRLAFAADAHGLSVKIENCHRSSQVDVV